MTAHFNFLDSCKRKLKQLFFLFLNFILGNFGVLLGQSYRDFGQFLSNGRILYEKDNIYGSGDCNCYSYE